MLTATSAAIVTATLPLLKAHGEEVTGHFYQRMFAENPELLNLFNRGNQATGQQRQALAASVVAYAERLVGDTAAPWNAILDRIAHKHASLGITPAQYTIVGRNLIAAVGEVLGEAVTPEIAAAWDETYWLMACELVARESRLYHTAGVGLDVDVWHSWRVTGRTDETGDVVSFRLAPADGTPAPSFTPGQYVSVAVDLTEDDQQIRQYSLSGRPGAAEWQITVKRIRATADSPAGAVSTYLHEQVSVGDTLRLSPAFGEVSAVAGDGPLVLISAGIGLTPAMSALEYVAETTPDRAVLLAHADRSESHHALRQHLPRFLEQLPNLRVNLWYEDVTSDCWLPTAQVKAGWIDPDLIPLEVASEVDVHLCGPLPFMTLVRGNLLTRGVPVERIGYEVFGPGMLHGA
ncbi:FAD-binding oxidoreductase [Micromonospora polyrhachis]|uniref:nitric oxide dioxygenase n=1 Tax=Micromonospora polyrhachis TaxID=1282883 RepID=A0A7W7SX14_9ACTN|nr:globin domain-containing protein [Micromonospora polyrhachis]MBB4962560.1 nitric oxide dioxygenase [Micromonospora polyrhachis]